MAKTYKTKNGLDNAVGKILGAKSVASEKSGQMTQGWFSIPITNVLKEKHVRYFMIDVSGYPERFKHFDEDTEYDLWVTSLKENFGGFPDIVEMFGYDVAVVDIPLEVSK